MSDETIQQEHAPALEQAPVDAVAVHEAASQTVAEIAAQLLSEPEPKSESEPLIAASVESMAAQLVPEMDEEAVPHEAEPELEETQIVETVSVGSLPGFWNLHVRYVNNAGGVSDAALQFGTGRSLLPLWKSKGDFVAVRREDYKGILLVPCPEIVSV